MWMVLFWGVTSNQIPSKKENKLSRTMKLQNMCELAHYYTHKPLKTKAISTKSKAQVQFQCCKLSNNVSFTQYQAWESSWKTYTNLYHDKT